ncbi:MAG: sulfatase-like hydrolase/transferase [Candidatus Omnitrophica bacterium]|nr:sulfatase-like hydrolase/transferase [Candidatus Omnitrophota bacterium]MCA9432382.1 sulfatase-like hydrolase/transferase [Candidatus Omnitrophota bacterium]
MIRWLTLLLFTISIGASCETDRPPNIVWIWADNLAYQDLACYGNESVETPNIDRLAEGGVRFTQYYIAHTVCSPSRAGFLTGRQPHRVGIVDVLRPDSPSGIPDDEITIAEALKERGYKTAAYGKWHLGDRKEFLPIHHGFDTYFGLPYSMDMLPTLLIKDDEIVERLDGDKVQTITERLVDSAIEFIEENREDPFFIYFNHTIPHPPINLKPEDRREGKTLYQSAVEVMDRETGRLIDCIDELGLRENTLIVFSSDNGPMVRDGETGVLRGRIRDAHEGGIRVPMIANWPGKIPEKRTVEEPAIAYDFFPTFLHLAGAEVPTDRIYDGQDIWPLLSGEGEIERENPFVWIYFDRVTALRSGNWKLHLGDRERQLEDPTLYDLATDPGESHSLATERPEVVEALTKKAKEIESDLPFVWNLKYPVRDAAKRPSGVRRE